MSKMLPKGIRIVNETGRAHDTNVYDLETGEQLTNVRRIALNITRDELSVELTLITPVVYEGPSAMVPDDSENTYDPR